MMIYSHKIANDAGLLRQYVAEHYGAILTFGGPGATMDRAMRMVRRLAVLASVPVDRVLADIRADYQELDRVIANVESMQTTDPAGNVEADPIAAELDNAAAAIAEHEDNPDNLDLDAETEQVAAIETELAAADVWNRLSVRRRMIVMRIAGFQRESIDVLVNRAFKDVGALNQTAIALALNAADHEPDWWRAEPVEVNIRRYERSHGKRPAGFGAWVFEASGRIPGRHGKKLQTKTFTAKYSSAKKFATEWAREIGADTVYVCE